MRHTKIWLARFTLALAMAALGACGGGGGGGGGSAGGNSSSAGPAPGTVSTTENEPTVIVAGLGVNQQQASRFLTQASFGPTTASISAVTSSNVESWIEREFQRTQINHLDYVDQFPLASQSQNIFWESFWKRAVIGKDQLRQRMAFALSQIFVISFDGDSQTVRGVASYYDMLGRDAFGNFRTLLEDVSMHPAMGTYLTHIHNQKENLSTGRMPDENYAREVMQLFTIGLYQLNADGTPKLVSGQPVETYTNTDVTGLAKVFTGFSWGGADKSDTRFYGGTPDPNRDVIPMQAYPKFHSTSVKSFLGVTIPAQGTANPAASLSVGLDTLFNHPNVGPFIGKQLIQRLVTSNPSPAYVARVSAAFNNNGSGVRGDMKAVIRAILLDDEARNATTAQGNAYGKLREPVIRLANWTRAFNATTPSTRFAIGDTTSTNTALGQAPFRSPSVFNFYRPGYVPPNTLAATNGLVVPEMQITHETSVAGYINYMQGVIQNGPGSSSGQAADRVTPNYAAEIALADTPSALVDRINLLLLANNMKSATRTLILNAVSAIPLTGSATAIETARKNRVYLAIFLAMASPDYLVQK